MTCGIGSSGGGSGRDRSVRPLLVCAAVLALVLGHHAVPSAAQCAESDRPTMMRIRRRHLTELSAIATGILGSSVTIPNSYTDAELLMLLSAMRELSPKEIADFEETVGRAFSRALDHWLWMCRAQQTLGKRRRRDSVADGSA